MSLKILPFVLGPLGNNTYLIADSVSREAAVIDPSFDPQPVLDAIESESFTLTAIWITHAHFDHIAGVPAMLKAAGYAPSIALHPADLPFWRENGYARRFGYDLNLGADPSTQLQHQQILQLGSETLEVRHTPGHSLGHVVFYSASTRVLFCGDLIFRRSIGRTDLPGGSQQVILQSIQSQVFTLPPDTRLLSGHGPETTVAEEIAENPYLQ